MALRQSASEQLRIEVDVVVPLARGTQQALAASAYQLCS
jgi:hypothetical protein